MYLFLHCNLNDIVYVCIYNLAYKFSLYIQRKYNFIQKDDIFVHSKVICIYYFNCYYSGYVGLKIEIH